MLRDLLVDRDETDSNVVPLVALSNTADKSFLLFAIPYAVIDADELSTIAPVESAHTVSPLASPKNRARTRNLHTPFAPQVHGYPRNV